MGILGDQAPTFSQDRCKTLGAFVIGPWVIKDTSGLGDSKNRREVASGSEVGSGKKFDFNADGSFTFVNGPYTFQGVWTDQDKTVALDSKMLNNKPLAAAISEIRHRASSGRQGDIANDIFIDWAEQELPGMSSIELTDNFRDLRFTSDKSTDMPGQELKLPTMSPSLLRLGPVKPAE